MLDDPVRIPGASLPGMGDQRAERLDAGAGYRYIDLMDPQLVAAFGTVPQWVYTAALRISPAIPQPASL